MEHLTEGLNRFGFDLLRNVYTQSLPAESTVLSNISVFIALLMAMAGAKDTTRDEILQVLKIKDYLQKPDSLSQEQELLKLHESVHTLYKQIMSNDTANQVVIANKMILNNLEVKQSFEHVIKSIYESSVDLVTSDETFQKVVMDTNKWISDLTNNKITNILDQSFRAVSLTLINAIYFKCEWVHEFDSKKTQKKEFLVSRTHRTHVDMMELNKIKFMYFYSNELNSHLLTIPYKNEKYMFNIIFPSNDEDYLPADDKTSLINRLDYDILKKEMSKQSYESISLEMPKFTVKKKMNLNDVLKTLGLLEAFDSKRANFRDISNVNNLYIQQVLQHSFIEVNEKGTEAAAATVIKMVKRSISPIIHLKIDRPFLYYISEKSTGAVLFLGSFNGQVEEESNESKLSEKSEL